MTKSRAPRLVSEREIALALVLELAESKLQRFSLLSFYDDDARFLADLADRLNVEFELNNAFHRKLTKVVRRLVAYGVLDAEMRGTHKEYIGEPAKQMNYSLPPGKANLLTKGKTDFTMMPDDEAAFLLRRAYPDPFSF